MTQAHLFVKGDVIGVGFRAWTAIQAKKFGVTGWVKNVYDRPAIFGYKGEVEAVFQGEEQAVNNIVNVVRQGPPVSRVTEAKVVWEKPKETFIDFQII